MLTQEKQYEQHLEQYKMLREEIFFHLRETRKLEIYAVAGVAALYAWLSTHNVALSAIWFVGTIIPIFGGIRSLVSLHRIKEIAAYLRELENAFFTSNGLPKGWEIYFKGQSRGTMTNIAKGFWVSLLIITIFAPFFLGK
ncbi:MAG: hypothetical protein HOP02_15680 [Methylococcaceae bacterium]|nr:hypothetical protein [Methylococcaceae bacterium]